MNLYLDSGYVNMKAIINAGLPFNFVVGGRATGKTYTTLKTVKEDNIKFMFMRRTQSQLDLINKPEFSPFKSLNRDMGWNVHSVSLTKYNAGFYDAELVDGKPVPSGEPIGYSCALSTVSNMRGFDASDVTLLIYDEFIPERHERPIKNEGSAFLNAYETINRNRELQGRNPLQVVCLANANDLANPIFIELGLVSKAEKMKRKGQDVSIDRNRGIGIFMLNDSPISTMKKTTALYRLTTGSEFERMSLSNDFASRDYTNVANRPLQEYNPVVRVGELCIYQHKSNGKYYVSTHTKGSPTTYGVTETELARFRKAFFWVWTEYMMNRVEFEEVLCELLLTKYFK